MFDFLIEIIYGCYKEFILVIDVIFFELPLLINFLMILIIYVVSTALLNVVKVATLHKLLKRVCLILFFFSICYSLSLIMKQPMVIS
jgi:hypothetical protein